MIWKCRGDGLLSLSLGESRNIEVFDHKESLFLNRKRRNHLNGTGITDQFMCRYTNTARDSIACKIMCDQEECYTNYQNLLRVNVYFVNEVVVLSPKYTW